MLKRFFALAENVIASSSNIVRVLQESLSRVIEENKMQMQDLSAQVISKQLNSELTEKDQDDWIAAIRQLISNADVRNPLNLLVVEVLIIHWYKSDRHATIVQPYLEVADMQKQEVIRLKQLNLFRNKYTLRFWNDTARSQVLDDVEMHVYSLQSLKVVKRPSKNNLILIDCRKESESIAFQTQFVTVYIKVASDFPDKKDFELKWISGKSKSFIAISKEHDFEVIIKGDRRCFELFQSDGAKLLNVKTELLPEQSCQDSNYEILSTQLKLFKKTFYSNEEISPVHLSQRFLKSTFQNDRETFGLLWYFWRRHPHESEKYILSQKLLEHLFIWIDFYKSFMHSLDATIQKHRISDSSVLLGKLQTELGWPFYSAMARFIEISDVLLFANNLAINGHVIGQHDKTLHHVYDFIFRHFPRTKEKFQFLDGYSVQSNVEQQRAKLYNLSIQVSDEEEFKALQIIKDSIGNALKRKHGDGQDEVQVVKRSRNSSPLLFPFDSEEIFF